MMENFIKFVIVIICACFATSAYAAFGQGEFGDTSAVNDEAYSATWDGDTTNGASRNALYDKIETIGSGDAGILESDGSTISLTTTESGNTVALDGDFTVAGDATFSGSVSIESDTAGT